MNVLCRIGIVALCAGTAGADIVDNFESYQPGSVPDGVWEDARHYVDSSTHTGDSVAVIQTTDAFGNPTQAVQVLDHVGTSGGLVSRVNHTHTQRMEVDVRFDQFGNGNVPNWMSAVGFYQELDGTDLNGFPQAMVWASRNGRFRLFVHNAEGQATGADTYALGGYRWRMDTWYRISIEADTLNGLFDVRITDIATGGVVVNNSQQIEDWDPTYGQYNLISMNDGEYGEPIGSVANMASFDNVNYTPTPGSIGVLVCGGVFASRRRRRACA